MSAEITTAVSQPRETTTKVDAAAWIKALSVATLLPLLGLAGGTLAWRRLAGALHEPLDAWTLATTAVVLAAASGAVRFLGRGYCGRGVSSSPWLAAAVLFGPTAAILAAGFSLNVPGTSVAGLAVLWGVLAMGELSGLVLGSFAAEGTARLTARAWRLAAALPETFKSVASPSAVARGHRFDAAHEPSAPAVEQSPLPAETVLDAATFDETPHGELTQQIVRMQASDGTETMSGRLRASFEPGQRTASVHLAFCPPFSSLPTVEVEQIDGPPGRIKTVQLLPYGVRFDLKLFKDAEEPLGVLLQFSARV